MTHLDIFENSFTAILVANADGNIIWANATSEQLFSTSSKRLRRYHIYDLLQTMPAVSLTQATPLSPLVCYDQWITGTQQPLFVDYSIRLLEPASATQEIESPEPQYLIEIWQKDRHHLISQEQQQQVQYNIARKMLRSVAHEVKNPLAGIRGAGQLLAKRLEQQRLEQQQQLDDKTQTYTDIIISETDRLAQLINQLMGAKQGTKQPQYTQINIHQPIEYVLTLLQSELNQETPSLQIIRDYDLSLPDIIADKDQLIQVFLNLVKNAQQAMETRRLNQNQQQESLPSNYHPTYYPTLTISTRVEFSRTIGQVKHKKVAKISIIDNGIGIDSDLIEQIFFPLVTGRAEGTGLGLSIAHDIIQQHQGHIEVDSEFAKTCFSIYLPFRPVT